MTSVRFNEDIESRLDNLAKMTGRTKSYYIRKAVEESLSEMEDTYVAIERLEDKKDKEISSKEMRRRLGLED